MLYNIYYNKLIEMAIIDQQLCSSVIVETPSKHLTVADLIPVYLVGLIPIY